MTTLRRESSSFNTQRRDSLTQARTRSRPKLLRSNATEPSITAPKAIKGSLVSPRSPRTATDMLNKVAVYPTTTGILGSSPAPETLSVHAKPIVFMTSGHTQPCDSQDAALSSSPRFGCYFSFPSFDNWDDSRPGVEDEGYGVNETANMAA